MRPTCAVEGHHVVLDTLRGAIVEEAHQRDARYYLRKWQLRQQH